MNKLPITEELDFAYLLELMPPLHGVPEFAWLPELFSIIGHEKLIRLCKYAGGETITIPTIDQLVTSIEVLQWFYDIEIKKSKQHTELPVEYTQLYNKMQEIYDARNRETVNT